MGHHTMASYSQLLDCDDDLVAHSTEASLPRSDLNDIFSPRHATIATPAATVIGVAVPALNVGSDISEVRGKCDLFCDVCTALEPSEDPAANELLLELKADLERVRAELQTRASLATEERDLMESLEQLELITDVLETYRQKAQAYQAPHPRRRCRPYLALKVSSEICWGCKRHTHLHKQSQCNSQSP